LGAIDRASPNLRSVPEKAVTDAVKTLIEADIKSCYDAWKIPWAKCVASKGRYFEGGNVDLDE
jgi:hypothetical protein